MSATTPYFVADAWYFARRDGTVIGPFATAHAAAADPRYTTNPR